MELAFGDLTLDSQLEVLKKCYVPERQFYDAGIQLGHYFDRPPQFAKKYDVEIIQESKKEAGRLQELYEKCEETL